MARASHAPPWLHRLERAFLLIALLALGWYAAARTAGTLSEAAGRHELAELATLRRAAATTTGAAARRFPPRTASLIGRIEIPRLKLSAIVREGVDAGTLRRAVGHVPGTALPGDAGNVALAAHRDTFFRPLADVREGDRILLETPQGTFRYVVGDTRIVDPAELSVLDPTPEPMLTLITCYPFQFIGPAPRRFIVRASIDRGADLRESR